MQSVADEVARAIVKFPTWPTDPLHALAVLGEEFGELTKAVLQTVYEPHKSNSDEVRKEAEQTAAMALRFLSSLDSYQYKRGAQHAQAALAAQEPYAWAVNAVHIGRTVLMGAARPSPQLARLGDTVIGPLYLGAPQADARDAARYRAWRDSCLIDNWDGPMAAGFDKAKTAGQWDAVIDAAIRALAQEG